MATIKEINDIVGRVLLEARKKKKKEEPKRKHEAVPGEYGYSESLDFSDPLGDDNLYKKQGGASWGPLTSPGTSLKDKVPGQKSDLESVLKGFMKESQEPSSWNRLAESFHPDNVWESAQRWYDHQNLGLGKQTVEGLEAKKAKLAKQIKKKGKK